MAAYKEDRRYESFEQRAAYDPRYVIDSRVITSKAARKAACAEADRIYVEMGKVRAEAKKVARDSDEFAAHVATFERYAAQRREIHDRIRAYDESKEA